MHSLLHHLATVHLSRIPSFQRSLSAHPDTYAPLYILDNSPCIIWIFVLSAPSFLASLIRFISSFFSFSIASFSSDWSFAWRRVKWR